MKKVFVDTVYWIAIANPKDQWRQAAEDAREQLGNARLVTTEEVLTEFLTALSKRPRLRDIVVRVVRGILGNPNVKVIPQSRDSFQRGLRRYEERPDKGYSLQDCISMNAMDSESITEILTNDHHFEQDGYTVLMKRNTS
ncbi:MAG: type II toxin-antitoxin system VapC family toxin [Nitrospira sp. SB0677_bin_15]|nr:type II toxin-antitoxin system VapC family toxin [Nitrospira sp. SB0667_bin_9]MYD30941.1 type II toxin-antitoxin system VapC family toxin [Nitrospira sp. SB0661_bin_20]MYG40228.1 type II toxin-antitoxin system VapC family toxin [Nitrospira sp. SB0677_bin_15]MYH01486.1 type II toxin-antitoxin system VapC family toxin [Nitrospira sp. SB0675_bin_23]MYJ21955.1 type II toxin-antitoxin system VapC family toxin [Nitrospira sp. SB0673_bin_12]